MELKPVRSSNLTAIGYDETTKTMRIRFNNGATWDYFDVPKEHHDKVMGTGLNKAERKDHSIGSQFQRLIRGSYKATRVMPGEGQ